MQRSRNENNGNLEKDLRPRDIVTAKALENALHADMALGCSTNTALHLPAIAHEAGLTIDFEEINRISKETPHLVKLAPAGADCLVDLEEAGGLSALMKELKAMVFLTQALLHAHAKQ